MSPSLLRPKPVLPDAVLAVGEELTFRWQVAMRGQWRPVRAPAPPSIHNPYCPNPTPGSGSYLPVYRIGCGG